MGKGGEGKKKGAPTKAYLFPPEGRKEQEGETLPTRKRNHPTLEKSGKRRSHRLFSRKKRGRTLSYTRGRERKTLFTTRRKKKRSHGRSRQKKEKKKKGGKESEDSLVILHRKTGPRKGGKEKREGCSTGKKGKGGEALCHQEEKGTPKTLL